MQGKITAILAKHYGFIDDAIFYHADDLEGITWDDIKRGDVVEFEPTTTAKGIRAQHVRRVDLTEVRANGRN